MLCIYCIVHFFYSYSMGMFVLYNSTLPRMMSIILIIFIFILIYIDSN